MEHPQPPGARDLLPSLRRGPGEAQSARVQRGVRTQVLPGGLPACQLSGLEYTIIITKHLGSYSVNQIFYIPSITVKCQLWNTNKEILKFCYFKAGKAGHSSHHVEYLLLESGGDLNPALDSLGIAHQDHVSSNGMFVFEEYEKEMVNQISLPNSNSLPHGDNTMSIDKIDEWILTGVKKVFEPKSKTKN